VWTFDGRKRRWQTSLPFFPRLSIANPKQNVLNSSPSVRPWVNDRRKFTQLNFRGILGKCGICIGIFPNWLGVSLRSNLHKPLTYLLLLYSKEQIRAAFSFILNPTTGTMAAGRDFFILFCTRLRAKGTCQNST